MPETEDDRCATGVMIGSGIGGLETIYHASIQVHEGKARRLSPFFIPSALSNLASGNLSIKYGFKGPNHSVVTACATGVHAIGDASRLIMWGDADVMVAGGAEATVCELGIAGFCASRALSTGFNDRPQMASRPWDKDRDGFVMGEGSGVLVLEEYEHALKRGAKIYAEIAGYGMSGDAYHITAPAEGHDGAFRSMRAAMKNGGVRPEDIQYVNAHGTSTPLGDDLELEAVERMFGDASRGLAMSSTKSATGHLLGAAGAIEAIFSILAIRDNVAPPTLNLDEPSREKRDRPRRAPCAGTQYPRGPFEQFWFWWHKRLRHLPLRRLIRPPVRATRDDGPSFLGGLLRAMIWMVIWFVVLGGAGKVRLRLWLRLQWDLPGPLAETKAVVVPHGGTGAAAAALKSAGVIQNATAFEALSWLTRLYDGSLRAAEFSFPAQATIADVLTILRTAKPVEHRITIVEGLTAKQIATLVMASEAASGPVEVPPEGSALPQTYEFERGMTREAILGRARAAMDKETSPPPGLSPARPATCR